MIPGINPRQAQQMMRKMGIAQQNIDAIQVIIRCADHTLIIDEPEVSKINMMGQDMFQVAGTARKEAVSNEIPISQEDIATVMEQTGATESDARSAIQEAQGDLAQAILSLSEE